MIQAMKNAKLPTEHSLLEAIWIYAKRLGLFLFVVVIAGGVLLSLLAKPYLLIIVVVTVTAGLILRRGLSVARIPSRQMTMRPPRSREPVLPPRRIPPPRPREPILPPPERSPGGKSIKGDDDNRPPR